MDTLQPPVFGFGFGFGCLGAGTWSKEPPAVLLVTGTLAVVAEARSLVVAGSAVHHKAVFWAIPRHAGAVLGQVAVTGRLPAHASGMFELWRNISTDGMSGLVRLEEHRVRVVFVFLMHTPMKTECFLHSWCSKRQLS